MTESFLKAVEYQTVDKQVTWQGISLSEGKAFEAFLTTEVSARLNDETEAEEFEAHLRSLATTGFARENLSKILEAEVSESRDWAVGEAMAEAYLTRQHSVVWPWNMERDKRTPKASLPGADLIGFEISGEDVRLALGEVKTSTDPNSPPGVMNGRSGMAHQIDNLATDLSLMCQLLKWLRPRCLKNEYEAYFNEAAKKLFSSGNKAVALFGVLIRDTEPQELDLRSRGQTLAKMLFHPSTCQLIAMYLPRPIADLPMLVLLPTS